jgi:hypothetical protein
MAKNYSSAETVQQLAESLIAQYHPELATARILYLFIEKAGKKGGKVIVGTVKVAGELIEYLGNVDFVMEIAMPEWNDASPQTRTALLDHLLERCTGEENPEDPGAAMKWKTREPDVHEFSTILQRYGAWNETLQAFVAVAQSVEETFEPVVERRVRAESGDAAAAQLPPSPRLTKNG